MRNEALETFFPQANCKDEPKDIFFPTSVFEGTKKRNPLYKVQVLAAKQICDECVVRDECLEYALVNRIEHGIFGGYTEKERVRILRQRTQLQGVDAETEIAS